MSDVYPFWRRMPKAVRGALLAPLLVVTVVAAIVASAWAALVAGARASWREARFQLRGFPELPEAIRAAWRVVLDAPPMGKSPNRSE